MKRLFKYAGSFQYLTIASWILSVISAAGVMHRLGGKADET